MSWLIPEFRLAAAILLNAAVFAAAWRFVRRRVASDAFDRAADVLLLVFVIQYVSVALPGVLGILHFGSIAITALAISAALWFTSRGPVRHATIDNPTDRWMMRAAGAFAVAYLGVFVGNMMLGYSPVSANDALIYHFPTAVQWLQTGRLGIYQPWFFNPTNAYSPVAGSTFIAWWIAPLGNSVLARYVQAPAHLLIFFAAIRIMRAAGVRPAAAAILAAALAASQPLIRQSIIEKDDLYLAGFFVCVVAAMSRERLTDALGTWRLGAAVGMMLATKYTALMIAPALLLLIDAPFRAGWRWRQWAVASGLTIALAGPWFIRNLILTGNPLYPMGTLLTSARSVDLPRRLWHVLTQRDQSMPVIPMILLLAGGLAAWAMYFRRIAHEPITRMILIAPIVIVAIFALRSPFPEARYVYPAFILLTAAAAMAISAMPSTTPRHAVAAIFLLAAVLTGVYYVHLLEFIPEALAVATVMLGITFTYDRAGSKRVQLAISAALVGVLLLSAAIYVYWPGYVRKCRDASKHHYEISYNREAEIWNWIRAELPQRERLAYSNTFLVLPLTGFNHARPIVYVPTRRGVRGMRDLPRWPGTWTDAALLPRARRELFINPDGQWWFDGLKKSGAKHIVIFLDDKLPKPPELEFIARHAERFELLLDHAAGLVYRVK